MWKKLKKKFQVQVHTLHFRLLRFLLRFHRLRSGYLARSPVKACVRVRESVGKVQRKLTSRSWRSHTPNTDTTEWMNLNLALKKARPDQDFWIGEMNEWMNERVYNNKEAFFFHGLDVYHNTYDVCEGSKRKNNKEVKKYILT